MNNHPPTDHPDALIDRGLAEVVGGETPPDLSDRILAAASTEQVPVHWRERNPLASNERPWIKYVLAASILLVIGVILLPEKRALRESARNHVQPRSEELVATKPPALSKTAKEQNWKDTIDTGIGLHGLINDAESPKSSDELMMAVTPQIIIEEGEEEERLGIPTEEESERPGIAGEEGTPIQSKIPYVGRRLKNQGHEKKAPMEVSGYYLSDDPHDSESPLLAAPNIGLYSQASPAEVAVKRSEAIRQLNSTSASLDIEKRFAEKSALVASKGEEAPNDLLHQEGAELFLRKNLRPDIQAGDHFAVTNTSPTAPKFSVDLDAPRTHSLGFTAPASDRDQYTPIHENPFIKADGPDAVSTFSIDVDTASYANVRQFLEQSRQLPPADAVRIEELVNYFDYNYDGPTDDKPFAAHMEVAACPWNKGHRLARIAIKGKEIARDIRPQSNLVFLVDVSGSMDEPNKLPLLIEGMKMLTRELGENDRVAIVVYASSEGMALPSTRGGEQETILAALDQLRAGGSTAGGAGINLAYQVALDNFIEGGTNRVILCTDGDFNVGVTNTAQLEQLAIRKAKTGVFLTVLGFGRGNLNDAMMEGISGKGNGNYHYVDNLTEARKVLVEEMDGTLVTIAKDVKIQVEFNPAQVAGYRLIGYENRMLKTEDFNDDKKDAGEIGAGHTVTALYEIIPAGQEVSPPSADPLKYQQPLAGLAEETTKSTKSAKPQATSNELLTLKLRYKLPEATQSTKLEFPITDKGESFADATDDFQFAAAVASFGMLLRHSQYQGDTSFDAVQEIAQAASENDPHNYRGEFLDLVRIAKELTTNQ